MTSPLVSYIVPCFNYETYIRQCLESLLNQTYSNIEILVINDGSTDKSASTFSIERYAAGDSSIAFKPAEEIGEEDKTWGMGGQGDVTGAKSSTLYILTGRILSIDPYRKKIVVQDRRHNTKTLYVSPSELSSLRKGAYIQATVRPGQERVDNIRQILGG